MPTLREAAQQALEALELSTPKARNEDDYAEQGWEEHHAAITALRAALAEPTCKDDLQVEPVQEPVAWSPALDYPDYEKQRVWANGSPRQDDIDYWAKQGLGITYAYTHPAPQRQPLTEEEMQTIYREFMLYQDGLTPSGLQRVARAIERAHGIGGQDE